MLFPNGIECNRCTICCCQIANTLTIRVGGSGSSGIGIPTEKILMLRRRVSVGAQRFCLVIIETLISHSITRTAIRIKCNGITVYIPFSVQIYIPSTGSNICSICIIGS